MSYPYPAEIGLAFYPHWTWDEISGCRSQVL